MQKFLSKKVIIIASIVLVVALLVLLALLGISDSSKVSAGVQLNSVPVGGKTAEEVSALLDEQIAQPKMVQIVVEDKQIDLDLNSAGFSLDKEKTIEQVMQTGKSNIFDGLKARFFHTNVKGTVISDSEMFVTVMDALLQTEGLNDKRFDYTIANNMAEITLKTGVTCYDSQKLYEEILAEYPEIKAQYYMETMAAKAPTVEEIKNAVNIKVIDAKMEKADGKTRIIPHQIGLAIDETVLAEKLAEGEAVFQVPVTVLNPKVYTDDLGEEAFPHKLATYTTKYNEGEVARSTNVKLAAKKVNGTVLNCGEVFSFNQVVGKRTHENGFRDAKIFLSDKVVDGTGGGICQVSSTIYPAVLYSDLKIVERRNHNFVVSYAKSGIDATVSYGSIDFKFQNSLNNPIRIKASAVNGNMTVEIWGTKENNHKVELSTETLGTTARPVKYVYNAEIPEGEQRVIQGGYDGVKVQSYRVVKDESGAVIRTDNLGVSNYVSLVRIIETSDLNLAVPENGEVPLPEATPENPLEPNPEGVPPVDPSVETNPAGPIATPDGTEPVTPVVTDAPAPVVTQAPVTVETPAPVVTQAPVETSQPEISSEETVA
ncbi:MAG: VanW family protein [Clostridia bacterium]|nr:VanW family protein [Clostridia bacterium]